MSDNESEEEYEVEAIVDFRDEDSDGNDVRQYEVKWKNFDSDENTWQDEDGLTDDLVKEKIKRFRKRQKQLSQEVRYISDDRQPMSRRKRSRELLASDDDDDYQVNDDSNHNYEQKRAKSSNDSHRKKSKKERRRQEEIERMRNRSTKGLNAYGSGSSAYARDMENQRLREKMERQKMREKMKSSRPTKLLGKQLPNHKSSSYSNKERSKKVEYASKVEKNSKIQKLISNNVLGDPTSPIQTQRLPSGKINKKKQTNSYESLKNNFNSKKNDKENTSLTEASDILDEF